MRKVLCKGYKAAGHDPVKRLDRNESEILPDLFAIRYYIYSPKLREKNAGKVFQSVIYRYCAITGDQSW